MLRIDGVKRVEPKQAEQLRVLSKSHCENEHMTERVATGHELMLI